MSVIALRTVIMYFTLLVGLRLSGKRQLGELELSEFVLAAMAADLASHPLQDTDIPLMNGLLPIVLLFCFELLIAGLALKSRGFRSVLRGRPALLIEKGRICQSELKRNRLSMDELTEQLRLKGCTDIATVDLALLETGGSMSIILSPSSRPLSAAQAGLEPAPGSYPLTVILEGRVYPENLESLGLDMTWLEGVLKARSMSLPEVFYMNADSGGGYYISRREET